MAVILPQFVMCPSSRAATSAGTGEGWLTKSWEHGVPIADGVVKGDPDDTGSAAVRMTPATRSRV